jgi:hypothetical protein
VRTWDNMMTATWRRGKGVCGFARRCNSDVCSLSALRMSSTMAWDMKAKAGERSESAQQESAEGFSCGCRSHVSLPIQTSRRMSSDLRGTDTARWSAVR